MDRGNDINFLRRGFAGRFRGGDELRQLNKADRGGRSFLRGEPSYPGPGFCGGRTGARADDNEPRGNSGAAARWRHCAGRQSWPTRLGSQKHGGTRWSLRSDYPRTSRGVWGGYQINA